MHYILALFYLHLEMLACLISLSWLKFPQPNSRSSTFLPCQFLYFRTHSSLAWSLNYSWILSRPFLLWMPASTHKTTRVICGNAWRVDWSGATQSLASIVLILCWLIYARGACVVPEARFIPAYVYVSLMLMACISALIYLHSQL